MYIISQVPQVDDPNGVTIQTTNNIDVMGITFLILLGAVGAIIGEFLLYLIFQRKRKKLINEIIYELTRLPKYKTVYTKIEDLELKVENLHSDILREKRSNIELVNQYIDAQNKVTEQHKELLKLQNLFDELGLNIKSQLVDMKIEQNKDKQL